ncbi:MAG: hypothetical protein KDA91_10580 [Planctomycetaceae bacterium]|nr:hypothetical protein [Planctomycetaceae bacterium]
MSEGQQVPGGVSPARKMVSTVFLVIALIVLAIELRAGLGQRFSGESLAKISTDGVFESGTSVETAQQQLSMSPSVTIVRDNEMETVYHYQWLSLLRTVVGQPPAELFLVATKTDPPQALGYYTDPDDANVGFYGDSLPSEDPMGESDAAAGMSDMSGGGYGGGGGGAEGGPAGGGGGAEPAASIDAPPSADAPATDEPKSEGDAAEGDAKEGDKTEANAPAADEPAADASASETPAANTPGEETSAGA